jgi:hypothetical protein
MAETTEDLIARLSADGAPVRRLPPPLWRAFYWLLAMAAAAAAAIFAFADLASFEQRIQDPRLEAEMIAALVTGVVAVIAAFHLSLPDRSPWWMVVPLPPLALWLLNSGYNCYSDWIAGHGDEWALGDSANCFRFIVGASLPLGASLLLMVRRARPLAPLRVATIGGLGVAAIAAVLLQFFHPFDITLMDLAVHAASIGLVVLIAALSRRAWAPR